MTPCWLHWTTAFPYADDPQNGLFVAHGLEAVSEVEHCVWHIKADHKPSTAPLPAGPWKGVCIKSPGGWRGLRWKSQSLHAVRFPVDAVLLHLPNPDAWPLWLWAKMRGIPVGIVEHRSAWLREFPNKSRAYKWFLKALFNASHGVAVPSEFLGEALRKAGVAGSVPFAFATRASRFSRFRSSSRASVWAFGRQRRVHKRSRISVGGLGTPRENPPRRHPGTAWKRARSGTLGATLGAPPRPHVCRRRAAGGGGMRLFPLGHPRSEQPNRNVWVGRRRGVGPWLCRIEHPKRRRVQLGDSPAGHSFSNGCLERRPQPGGSIVALRPTNPSYCPRSRKVPRLF